MSAPEIESFLSALATDRNVSASTQNLALSSILFLYKEVLLIDLPWLDNIVCAKKLHAIKLQVVRGRTGSDAGTQTVVIMQIEIGFPMIRGRHCLDKCYLTSPARNVIGARGGVG
ncbi:MAG: phage integrase N-terminal SAM-like domain-containing protein [Gammaproteobacteria bacterium]|nr:phage integrase N-terminal SAM-like domain-containing protein [Gammaproteobacteria bacterium]MBU1732823.1 phage integrase N-terminal SAM-like domain-containing protein [Gammaproteobacteria bacterium]MBU1891648.1 phage integrase N-terminal SAM-like domain-containing protein [Gammaproteobacteria bacterium]